MLLGLRVLPGLTLVGEDAVRLFAIRRGIFCHALHSRARPLGPSTRSPAARLIGFAALARPEFGRGKGNSTGGFYEIPIDDRGSSRASRHSERNFAFR